MAIDRRDVRDGSKRRPCVDRPILDCLEQADGTAWMALFADNMLEIAIELAMTDDRRPLCACFLPRRAGNSVIQRKSPTVPSSLRLHEKWWFSGVPPPRATRSR
jgi:hypothetical protein